MQDLEDWSPRSNPLIVSTLGTADPSSRFEFNNSCRIGMPLGRIDALLLTHYHSDHTVGIPDLWLTSWLQSHHAKRTAPFRVIGPAGARTLMSHLEMAYALAIDVQEFGNDGVVYEKDGVRVIAFES